MSRTKKKITHKANEQNSNWKLWTSKQFNGPNSNNFNRNYLENLVVMSCLKYFKLSVVTNGWFSLELRIT